MCAQNVYDDPKFFAGYSRLPRSESGLDAVYEWPAFQRLLPASLQGLRVLDLGCGFGYFAREARARRARQVVAVDLSERMLEAARAATRDDGIVYVRAALEDYVPDDAAFDLVVSSLALHYIADHGALVRKVAAGLVSGGRFAFSVEHPIFTADGSADWHFDANGARLHWPVDRYRDEGERRTRWFVDGVVKYHRTVETYVNGLLDAGLRLVRLEEPEADAAVLAAKPEWQDERRRPPFLLIAAEKS
ncbi:MAG TPA: class I SAM-dependent methyltransferase [Acetobacteraceae bacterium]|jgi:SAM-dependent methyltransferase